MKVLHARVHVANLLIVFSLFSLMTLHFDNMKFTTLIWEDSEYRFVFVALFVFNFMTSLDKLKEGLISILF